MTVQVASPLPGLAAKDEEEVTYLACPDLVNKDGQQTAQFGRAVRPVEV